MSSIIIIIIITAQRSKLHLMHPSIGNTGRAGMQHHHHHHHHTSTIDFDGIPCKSLYLNA